MLSASSVDADVYANPSTNNKNIPTQISAMELFLINRYLNLKLPAIIEVIKNNAKKILGNAVGKTIEKRAAHAKILLVVSANCANLFECQFIQVNSCLRGA